MQRWDYTGPSPDIFCIISHPCHKTFQTGRKDDHNQKTEASFGTVTMTRLTTNECDDAPSAMPSTSQSASAQPSLSAVSSSSPSASFEPSSRPSLSSQPSSEPSKSVAPSESPSTTSQPSTQPSSHPSISSKPSLQPSYDPAGKISVCAKSVSSSTGIERMIPNAHVKCFDYDFSGDDELMASGTTGADGCVLLQYDEKR